MQMNTFKRTAVSLAFLASAVAASSAHAGPGTVSLDVAGIASNSDFGSLDNEMRYIDILPGVQIIGLSWDVALTAFGTVSWLSEISVDLSDGGAAGATLNPGFDASNDVPGSAAFSGSFDLLANGAAFFLDATGRLHFQFFDRFDDYTNAADGMWDRGTLTVTYVPEPASFGLAALGLLGVGAMTRRRRA